MPLLSVGPASSSVGKIIITAHDTSALLYVFVPNVAPGFVSSCVTWSTVIPGVEWPSVEGTMTSSTVQCSAEWTTVSGASDAATVTASIAQMQESPCLPPQ